MILVQVHVPFSCCDGKGLSCCVSKGIVPRPCACMHHQPSGQRRAGWLRLRLVQAASLHGPATLPLQLTASCLLPPLPAVDNNLCGRSLHFSWTTWFSVFLYSFSISSSGHQVQHAHGGCAGGELPGHQNLPVGLCCAFDQRACCAGVPPPLNRHHLHGQLLCACAATAGTAVHCCPSQAKPPMLACLPRFPPPLCRFYYRCTHCSAEFCMKTDPKNAGGCHNWTASLIGQHP